MGFTYLMAFYTTSYEERSFNQTIGPLFDPTYYLKVIMIYDWAIILTLYALIGLLRFKTSVILSKIHLFTTITLIIIFEFQFIFDGAYFLILFLSYLSFILNIINSLYRREKV